MAGYLEWKRDAMIGATPWWNPGIDLNNCIAAYQFKGASSQSVALQDLTGHGHTLVAPRGITWSASKGVTFGYNSGNQFLTVQSGDTLRTSAQVKAIVVYYSGHTSLSDALYSRKGIRFSRLSFAQSNSYLGNYSEYDGCPILWGALSFARKVNDEWVDDTSKYPGIWSKWVRNGDDKTKWKLTYYRGTSTIPQTGVLACDPTQLYLDGNPMGMNPKQTVQCEDLMTTEIGGSGNSYHEGYEILQNNNFSIYAAAFYGVKLGNRHKQVYESMKAIM